ncbi:hypothetical protein BPAE_0049g00400 [Botrytis paeoniae]|uniref:Uncharacterized protein n=1 Tax=Botrytis paeoniae TaxID=278948 RepID=A0A4Z1FXZ4_9HELO|nr:hypothetical protein BPAE_0049g00400 [Botrytis paeoniae]
MAVNNPNIKVAGTEEREQEDLILQRVLGERKIKKEAKIAVENSKQETDQKPLHEIIEKFQSKHRAARNKLKDENTETTGPTKAPNLSDKPILSKSHRHNNSKSRNGAGADYVELVRENCGNPYAIREQDNSIYAIEDRDTEESVQITTEIEGKIREINVGTESETDALKKSIKDLERVMSNTARLIGKKRARLHQILGSSKSEKSKVKQGDDIPPPRFGIISEFNIEPYLAIIGDALLILSRF